MILSLDLGKCPVQPRKVDARALTWGLSKRIEICMIDSLIKSKVRLRPYDFESLRTGSHLSSHGSSAKQILRQEIDGAFSHTDRCHGGDLRIQC